MGSGQGGGDREPEESERGNRGSDEAADMIRLQLTVGEQLL